MPTAHWLVTEDTRQKWCNLHNECKDVHVVFSSLSAELFFLYIHCTLYFMSILYDPLAFQYDIWNNVFTPTRKNWVTEELIYCSGFWWQAHLDTLQKGAIVNHLNYRHYPRRNVLFYGHVISFIPIIIHCGCGEYFALPSSIFRH